MDRLKRERSSNQNELNYVTQECQLRKTKLNHLQTEFNELIENCVLFGDMSDEVGTGK